MKNTAVRTKVGGASLLATLLIAGTGLVCHMDMGAAASAYAEEGDAPAAASATWSADMDCALCHVAEATSLEGVAHGDIDLMTAAATSGAAATETDSADETDTGATPEDTDAAEEEATEEKAAETTENGGEAEAPESASDEEAAAPEDTAEDEDAEAKTDGADAAADAAETSAEEGDKAADTDSKTAAADGGATCTMCHTDTEALAETHENAEDLTALPKRLSKKIEDETCLTCHGSKEALAEATADSDVLTDTNGTTVNPHALPETASHESIKCVDCHRVHTDKDPAETANQKCMSCHHQNVYECYTCHE